MACSAWVLFFGRAPRAAPFLLEPGAHSAERARHRLILLLRDSHDAIPYDFDFRGDSDAIDNLTHRHQLGDGRCRIFEPSANQRRRGNVQNHCAGCYDP